ncbi:aldolase [Methanofollis aquaemaris]|uniref:Aldolase n=1 Tax=Methanofollis aquaemaris TaxID=126734 RepID=A0A8A3S4P6_9EURY|nr:aldolase [Methanofollis aquaemaris]QSZ66660.1 aldolase [Methanofollis aquaemaris]
MSYTLSLIPVEEKEKLVERYADEIKYEVKSEIFGCCIKLLTDDKETKERWEENFYFISQNIRSHGRLYHLRDPMAPEDTLLYDPQSRTAFLINVAYYGLVKSLALSVAGDVLEEEHGTHSVHGACIDAEGWGTAILGESGAGKTTQTYGLLLDSRVRVVSDDWFFARVYGNDVFAYGSEKNFYIRADLSGAWPEFEELIGRADLDAEERGVVDLRSVVGKGRVLPMTTLRTAVFLRRHEGGPVRCVPLDPEEALEVASASGYFNPHLLVRTPFREEIRRRFFASLLGATRVFEVTAGPTPAETQEVLREIVLGWRGE